MKRKTAKGNGGRPRAAVPKSTPAPPVSPGPGDAHAAVRGLFDVARRLTSAQDLDVLLKEIGRTAEDLTGAEASSILLLDEDGRHLHFKTASGEKGQAVKKVTVPLDRGIAGWVATHWKPALAADVAKDPRFLKSSDDASGFVTRQVLAVPMLMGERLVGVCEVLNKRAGTFSSADQDLLQDLANFAAVAVANAQMASLQHNFFANTLSILTQAIESHHPAYVGHPERVVELACRLGKALGMDGQPYKDLYHGALLHDIGMIAVNHHTLAAHGGGLAAPEKGIERLHSVLGWELLKDVKMLQGALPLVRHHHELWNGGGHPDGLSGEAIPLGARILCLIEHLEEIRFSGLKDPELSEMQVQLAQNGAGTKFDPRVVEAYLDTRRSLV